MKQNQKLKEQSYYIGVIKKIVMTIVSDGHLKKDALETVKLLYWSYKSKRESIEKLLPKSKILWKNISNCEWEIVEIIKRFC
jgi:hypothetical protein